MGYFERHNYGDPDSDQRRRMFLILDIKMNLSFYKLQKQSENWQTKAEKMETVQVVGCGSWS